MKNFKKIMALMLAMVMVMGTMSMAAFADETSQHVITITNTDQNVSHTYEGYQVFKGKLDDKQQKLSDIVWGDGVDGDKLLAALKASTDPNLAGQFDACITAADVAKVFETFQSTSGETSQSGAIDSVAKIIAETTGVLKSDKKIAFTENNKVYTATVTGDGYYFVKDVTTTLVDDNTKGSDTLSKYLLAVVKDTTVVAKDTGFTPDKSIVGGETRVKDGTAAVGDTVTFEVKIKVPDTRKYVNNFIFDMHDKLPTGMTFMGVTSVKVGSDDVPYTLTVAPADSTTYSSYTAPTSAAAAVTTAGGQQIRLEFTNFKTFAEGKDGRIGSDLVVTYTAVVNDKADFTPTGNENEVHFVYSTDPNHDYGGEPDGPKGETPKDKTRTYLTNIEVLKTGDNGKVEALAGAEFEITSDDYNVTLVTGEKFELSTYTPVAGETVLDGTWYKLKDGSYTTTAPTDDTASSYDSTTTTYKKIKFEKADTTPGSTKKVTVITGEDGKIKLEGLKPGTYKIKETKAPTGYNLDPTEHVIKLTWNPNTKKIELDATASDQTAIFDGTTATANITIDDKSGSVLPSTGGIGTTMFYVVGAILVTGAAVLLISRRRMNMQ